MKKIIYLVIFLLAIGGASIIFYTSKSNIKVQIRESDFADGSQKIVKETNIQVGDIINLDKYCGNDVKILEITDENVKISRDAIRYEIINQTSLYSGEVKKYTETVIETIDYDTFIKADINSPHPFNPECLRRYYYSIKFIK